MAAASAVAVFLLLTTAFIGGAGRERAKRAVCLANLRQLTAAWNLYADDNDGKIVNGDPDEYTTHQQPNSSHYGEKPWVLRDWEQSTTPAQRKAAIEQGALFPYCRRVRLYSCPTAPVGHYRTYTVADAMNCKGSTAIHPDMIMLKRISEILNPAGRFVFVEDGGTTGATLGGWTCYLDRDQWWDPPPLTHNDGTNFSFADGHSEYWQWQDPRTIYFGRTMRPFSENQPDNPDIRRTQVAAWGEAAMR